MRRELNVLTTAAVATVFAFAAQAREFRSADVHPLDYPTVQTVQQIGKILSEKTGGKYTIKVFGNSTLGSENDTAEQVKIGALDMVRVNTAVFHQMVPESMILSLPFLYRDIPHHHKVIYGPIGHKILEAFNKAGYEGIMLQDSGARCIYSKKAIRTLADVKGLKLRVQPSDLWVGLVKAMGANPMVMPYAEIYTGLKTGLVDAAENNYPSYETQKHFEGAPFYNETQHVMAPEVVVFSKKIWDTLTAEEKANLKTAGQEAEPFYQKLWDAKQKASRDIVLKNGTTIVSDVAKAEFQAAVKPVWDQFANTPELKKLVEDIVNTK